MSKIFDFTQLLTHYDLTGDPIWSDKLSEEENTENVYNASLNFIFEKLHIEGASGIQIRRDSFSPVFINMIIEKVHLHNNSEREKAIVGGGTLHIHCADSDKNTLVLFKQVDMRPYFGLTKKDCPETAEEIRLKTCCRKK